MSGQLHDCLRREVAAINVFVDLLDREADAMRTGDFAKLQELATQKSAAADQIALLERERETEQLALGFPAGRLGAEAACATSGDAELGKTWHSLLARATLAQQHNQRNGLIVHTQLEFTQQTIRFLQHRDKPLYGPDGSASTGAASGKSLGHG